MMKMTMYIDEADLAEVMKVTGAKSKTAAVATALKEMARKAKLKSIFEVGLGMTPVELKDMFDPASVAANETMPAYKTAAWAEEPMMVAEDKPEASPSNHKHARSHDRRRTR